MVSKNPNITIGMNVKISYFEQENAELSDEKNVFEEIHDRFPSLYRQEIQNILGRMLISGEDVYKKIGMLSGGEKAKVKFAVMMLTHGNVLILDEPTNHLDLPSKEELDDALGKFEGTVIIVSHDRYLLNKVPDKIIEFTENGLKAYNGNYDSYLKEKSNEASETANNSELTEKKSTSSEFYRSKKDRAAAAKKASELKKIEKEIEEAENEVTALEKEMTLPEVSGNFQLLTDKCSLLESLRDKLNILYEKWEVLSDE